MLVFPDIFFSSINFYVLDMQMGKISQTLTGIFAVAVAVTAHKTLLLLNVVSLCFYIFFSRFICVFFFFLFDRHSLAPLSSLPVIICSYVLVLREQQHGSNNPECNAICSFASIAEIVNRTVLKSLFWNKAGQRGKFQKLIHNHFSCSRFTLPWLFLYFRRQENKEK